MDSNSETIDKMQGADTEPRGVMTAPRQGPAPEIKKAATPEIVAEWSAIMANVADRGSRRLFLTSIFIGVNTLFLAAEAYVAVTSHFAVWWGLIIVAALAIAIEPANWAWLQMVKVFRTLSARQYQVLVGMETRYAFAANLQTELTKVHPSRTKPGHGQFESTTETFLVEWFLALHILIIAAVAFADLLVIVYHAPPFTLW